MDGRKVGEAGLRELRFHVYGVAQLFPDLREHGLYCSGFHGASLRQVSAAATSTSQLRQGLLHQGSHVEGLSW